MTKDSPFSGRALLRSIAGGKTEPAKPSTVTDADWLAYRLPHSGTTHAVNPVAKERTACNRSTFGMLAALPTPLFIDVPLLRRCQRCRKHIDPKRSKGETK